MKYNYEILTVPSNKLFDGERYLDNLGAKGFKVIDIKMDINNGKKYFIYHLERVE
jgi:hypothetical protein